MSPTNQPPDSPPATHREAATGRTRRVWAVIDTIDDPHIPASLVDMGMIYNVTIDGTHAAIELTYPCLGCPAYDMIQDDIRNRVTGIAGIESVGIEVVWDPPWSKDRLTPEVREQIRAAGIDV